MKYTLEIRHDEFAESPARDSEGIQLLTAHRNVAFGTHNFTSGEACDAHLASMHLKSRVYAMPVYAYIHSGIALSLSPFACSWDSGMIGWLTVDMDMLGLEPSSIKEVAQAFIDEMNEYLSGEVYGYVIKDEDGNQVDSCWGYYGDPEDSGCKSEGEAALAALMLNEVTLAP